MQREYFYTIDLEGRLFHDGTRLEDQRFLAFFFSRLRPNTGDYHSECPYVSPCGPEQNYVSTSDSPIVFMRLTEPKNPNGPAQLEYNYSGLHCDFEPDRLQVSRTGVLYHPAHSAGKEGFPRGRIQSSLLLELADWIRESGDDYVLTFRGSEFPILSI